MTQPLAIIIGGANGAGKTTFARKLLPLITPPLRFLNADEVQRSAHAFDDPIAAGRELIRRLRTTVAARDSFAIETTLSGLSYVRQIRDWRAAGYLVALHFIEVPSADFAVERVRRRVAEGGHEIAEVDIRRRFARGLENLSRYYRAAVDDCYHWQSDEMDFRLIEQR